ncbi:MAG: hypothetical protein ACFFD1_13730, partial [Candidatus Thorarchaeota archaeon]
AKLETLEQELSLEKRWLEVYEKEDEIDKAKEKISENVNKKEEIENNLQKINNKLETKQIIIDKEKKSVEKLNSELKKFDKLKEDEKDRKSSLKGRISTINGILDDKIKILTEYESVLANKQQVKTYQDKLKEVESLSSQNKAQIEQLNDELHQLEDETKKEEEKISLYEQDIITSSLDLKTRLENDNLSTQVVGPIIEKIRMKNEQQDWQDAVTALIGDYLFSFVALTPDVFDQTKKIYDELFLENKPAFHVFLFSNIERKRPEIDERIYSFAPDLLEGSPEVLLTLKNVMSGSVAENLPPRELAEAARKTRLFILTKDCENYYTPGGSFTRPPRKIKSSLGSVLHEPLKAKELRRKIKEKQTQIALLQRLQPGYIRQLGELKEKVHIFSSKDQDLISKKLEIEEEINSTKTQIKTLTKTEEELGISIENITEKIQTIRIELKQSETIISDTSAEIKILLNDKEKIEENRKEIEEKLKEITDIQSELFKETNNLIKELQSFGSRPVSRRQRSIVENDLTEVRTKLSMIKNKSIGMDKLEHQEELVQELQKTFNERLLHLENLRNDLNRRKDDWDKEIRPFFISLNEKLQELSKNIFYQTRVFFEPEDLDKAGLILQAVTKEEWRLDSALSSGEKVMLMECMILSLHALSKSPLHAIDEFTQRLDLKNKNKVFRVVEKLIDSNNQRSGNLTQFILITQDAFGIDLGDIQHIVFAQAKIISEQ